METAAITIGVWSVLAAGAVLAPALGRAASLLTASGLALALLLWSRAGAAPPRGRIGEPRRRRALAACAVAALAGYLAYPAWIVLTALLGGMAGLQRIEPIPPSAFVAAAAPFAALQLGLAPALEELLFRERLVPALRVRLGGAPAVALSSVLFAAAHGEPWRAVGALCVGLVLGAVYHRTGSVAWCIGYHLGLNAAALLCGSPPVRWALPAAASAVCGLALAWAALRLLAPGAGRSVGLGRGAGHG